MSCDDDPDDETNPYPDGVYPFEVTGITHTYNRQGWLGTIITWTNPSDSGFKNVEVEMTLDDGVSLIYSSATGYVENDVCPNLVLEKNKLSFYFANRGNNKVIAIKCVDKFGNISNGVEYKFSSYPPD
jgi:hypothetical protein